MLSPPTPYDQDFYAWTQQMAAALRQQNWAALDIENLAEEIENLGKSDRRALKSRLEILIMHLLKWQFQPTQRSNSWKATITEQRLRIQDLLADSPSLKNYLNDTLPTAYRNAKRLAADETGLALSSFPETCAYSVEQLLENDQWLPAEEQSS
ncbi:DUF29 domain-containing protein [Almyronema epifaneia]|uniref:DUF29 domain-containing protein n=1 Tax=Almyronema epifaneia S1 TaxID=2991925 RepID=A0ABW6IBM2_9CYAN